MQGKKTAKILIVDDHPLVREGLWARISGEADMEICGEADNATDALKLAQATSPDVVILDLSLKGGSGLELIKALKANDDRTRMLVVSMHDESLYAERALRAGAMGYLPKAEASAKVIEAVRRILDGKLYLSDGFADRLLTSAIQGPKDADQAPDERLSDRELEVLEMIGQGMKSSEIAERLHLSPKTIESHRERIKQKLNLRTSGELVRHAVERVLSSQGQQGQS